MKKAIYVIVLLLLLVFDHSFAQKRDYKIKYDSARTFFLDKNYQQALQIYLKLDSLSPDNENIKYHIGVCYIHMPTEKSKAIAFLEKACDSISLKYSDKYRETKAPVFAYYFLGKACLINYELDKAIAATEKYKTFLDEKKKEDKSNMQDADHQIEMCNVAKEMVKYPVPARVENLGGNINTKFPEYSPVINKEGNTLIFTSRRESNIGELTEDNGYYFEDLYSSKQDSSGKWGEAVNMGPLINSKDHEASISISPDNKKLFIYKDRRGNGNIYVSTLDSGAWSKPKKLPAPINSGAWETHATLSADSNVLYFTSNRKGGFGGTDIYKSTKDAKGKWGKPVNLGSSINTKYNEDAPFILLDNRLYFSSEGHKSMGGFDVFYSKPGSDGSWSTPENLGYPINTTDDDLFYTPLDSLTAYVASVRNEGLGNLDIYKLWIHIMVKGIAQDKYTNEIIPGTIITMMNDKMEAIDSVVTDDKGAYNFIADYNTSYHLKSHKDKYNDAISNISTSIAGLVNELTTNILLEKEGQIVFKLQVLDAKTNQPVSGVRVELKDTDSGTVEALTTNENGEVVKLRDDKKLNDSLKYSINLSKDGYRSKDVEYAQAITKTGEILYSETISTIEAEENLAMFSIHNIYFDLDKYNIRPDASNELDNIVNVLNEYPSVEIELGSHTDCRASNDYNMNLSENRAKSTEKYLISKGVSKSRIVGKWYGETRLATDCPCEGAQKSSCSEEDHQLNRRTEFKITGFVKGVGNVNIISQAIKMGNQISDMSESGLVYRIQLMAGDDIPFTDPGFKGLQNISKYKHKGLFKYTWGVVKTKEEALVLKNQMIEKGFSDAFIVPFLDNERISMNEAEKISKK
ncbi:MAG TPA: OmpA family protein [Bacteroidales bacterium]|nr:OmpA family protein [Bacteroidales bacterium]